MAISQGKVARSQGGSGYYSPRRYGKMEAPVGVGEGSRKKLEGGPGASSSIGVFMDPHINEIIRASAGDPLVESPNGSHSVLVSNFWSLL